MRKGVRRNGENMEKREFLDRLHLALSGKLAPEIVSETINYYEEYISTEVRMGRSEEEVMTSLGDPRLIARTIVETKGGQAANSTGTVFSEQNNGNGKVQRRYPEVPGWVWLVLILIIVVLILSTVFKLLAVFWPFIAVMALVIFLVKLFRDWIN